MLVTTWLAGGQAAAYQPGLDLPAYRDAVTRAGRVLRAQRRRQQHPAGRPRAVPAAHRPRHRRRAGPDPSGGAGALERLLLEVRGYRPSPRSSATSLASLIRISLLAQIDAAWWGREPAYPTDADVLAAPDLLNLDALQQGGLLLFRYRHQAGSFVGRAARSVERRALPGRRPMTAGLWLARARPQAVALLNQIAAQFAVAGPAGTPPLWVTSLARSVEHQRRLRALGYAALLPSSHCVGYAADIEMAWFRRFGAHHALQAVLLEPSAAGTSTSSTRARPGTCACGPASTYGSRLVPGRAATGAGTGDG